MGHKLLILAMVLTIASAKNYPDIDELVEKVKEPRKGLSPSYIAKLKNPFVNEKKLVVLKKEGIVKAKKRKRGVRLHLLSIFNNRAKINGRWYTIGSRVGNFRLVSIGDNYVRLQNRYKTLKLFLPKRKSKFIKIEKWR